ncbi:8223_t:CDS:2, partial [Gigaspora rosea]
LEQRAIPIFEILYPGEKQNQKMIFPEDYLVEKLKGQPKGIQQILEECNLWLAR